MNFDEDNDFIGEFPGQHYTVIKKYLDTEERQVRLYHTKFTPKNPKYSICIIHGFGEHSGRFHPIADFFAKYDFEVLLVDLRGFGYSGAPRGCATVPKLQNDVITLLKEARQDLPLFLYAHSLGGLVAIKLLLDRPQLKITGCVVTSPLLGLTKDRQLPWIKIQIMKLLGQKMQDFVINSMVNPTALTKNSKYIHSIFEDRMMIPFLSIKMAKSIIQTTQNVMSRIQQFKYPIIIFHGKADSVTNYQDSKKFIYTKLTAFKQLHLFENGFHQLQHDVEKDELLELSLKFIDWVPQKYPFGKINIKSIDIKKIKQKNYYWIAIIIIGLLFLLKKVKNINVLEIIMRLIRRQ